MVVGPVLLGMSAEAVGGDAFVGAGLAVVVAVEGLRPWPLLRSLLAELLQASPPFVFI